MQASLEGGAIIVRGPGVRGLLAAGTSSGDMLLLDPASGYKVGSPPDRCICGAKSSRWRGQTPESIIGT